MPNIVEIKEIDGVAWVRADTSEVVSGSSWWTPKEREAVYKAGYEDGYNDAREELR